MVRRSVSLALFATLTSPGATWQAAVDHAMAGTSGTAIIANVGNGSIVAVWNRSIADNAMAAPGSAIKPFSLAAMIDAGRLPPHADWLCSGHLTVGSHNLACTHPRTAVPLDAVSALAYSCNEFFVHFASALPPERLRTTLEAYGFDVQPASGDELRLQAIGESRVRITPARLLAAYRRLALARRNNRESLTPVFRGMEASAEYGTSRAAAIAGWPIAGKTGTGPEYGWFAGYAPADRPEWVMVVAVPHGSGSGDAATRAHDILARYRDVSEPGEVSVDGHKIALEDYVAGVLAGETANYRAPQALRAMAVAARTYAVRFRGRHRSEGFDFCSLTHCQRFKPDAVTSSIRDAVDATAGELVWFQGSPAATYYSQDCGGRIEPGGEPYLRAQSGDACTRKGRMQWNAEIPLTDLSRALQCRVQSVEVASQTSSGRAQSVRVSPARTFAAVEFRLTVGQALGWNLIRSDLYSVRNTPGKAIFTGYGAGHGIGLCQNGAEAMASTGASDREILAAYYPGTSVGLTARGLRWRTVSGERVELWATDDKQQRWIPIAESALREAERRAGFTVPSRVRLQIFPSLETFRNATGEPGTVLASTRGAVIRTQPSLDDVTLRHEVWHALIESRVSRNLPDWYREGLALALSGSQPGNAERTAARDRVRRLIAQYGEKPVLGWAAGRPAPAGVFAK